MITTDKVYDNAEWMYAYREEDPLGGHDPYSASKACAELVISSYRRSFFDRTLQDPDRAPIALASVRGGNVVGGGDWALDRIVPDSVRSLSVGEAIRVRHRYSTRPWQHVLELLGGYLYLGALIDETASRTGERDVKRLRELSSAFNIGPQLASNRTVEELVKSILGHWAGDWTDLTDPDAKHEAGNLNLTIDKAYHVLGWEPRWSFDETIRQTIEWYHDFYGAQNRTAELITELTRKQIHEYDEGLQLRL
jgi:CDP-glucose 4,6-dehydratase